MLSRVGRQKVEETLLMYCMYKYMHMCYRLLDLTEAMSLISNLQKNKKKRKKKSLVKEKHYFNGKQVRVGDMKSAWQQENLQQTV